MGHLCGGAVKYPESWQIVLDSAVWIIGAGLVCLGVWIVTGCARLPNIPATERADISAAPLSVDSLCSNKDPFTTGFPDGIESVQGSAVIVDDRHALTALHVVDCFALHAVRVTMANGRFLRMVVDKVDRERDLARMVIMSDELFGLGAAVVRAMPAVDAPSCTASAQPEREINCGRVERVNHTFFEVSQRTRSGNSGSGVYQNGRLVGVLFAKHPTKDKTGKTLPEKVGGFAVPVKGVWE